MTCGPERNFDSGPGRGPLAGIRVVALEQAVSLPYCSFVLGELGAEIIKIERPDTGDVVRGWDDVVDGLSSGFVWVNSNKRSVTLDLARQSDKTILRQLIATADIFMENLGPGATAKLGFDAVSICGQNPALIYCSLSGFGQDGPYRDVKSYDLTVQCEAGILLSNGYPGMPAKVGLPITDLIAGSNAVMGIQAALIERQRIGKGRILDVAMLDSSLLWLGYFPHHAWHRRTEPPMSGMRHQYLCPYGPYMAKDGSYICFAIANQPQWVAFCNGVVERPDWIDDPRIATLSARTNNRELAEKMVEEAIAARPRAVWIERMRAAGLPYGVVRTMAEVVNHPQALAREMFVKASSPVGTVPIVRFPLAHPANPRVIPALGQHNGEIADELAASTAQVP
ncbi:CaiB/BaiF CoA transferase family protein [Bradyrhizobium manausense]